MAAGSLLANKITGKQIAMAIGATGLATAAATGAGYVSGRTMGKFGQGLNIVTAGAATGIGVYAGKTLAKTGWKGALVGGLVGAAIGAGTISGGSDALKVNQSRRDRLK